SQIKAKKTDASEKAKIAVGLKNVDSITKPSTIQGKVREDENARLPSRYRSARKAPRVQSNQSMVGDVQMTPARSLSQSVKKTAPIIRDAMLSRRVNLNALAIP